MVITTLADSVTRGVETLSDGVSEALFEPVIRIGVTGLARSGKTVFITSMVANLLETGRMPGLVAARNGRIEAAFLQPQPDDTVPRFDYETHLAAMTGDTPRWPASTRAISELRLSLRVRPRGLLAGLQRARTIHIDIIDYPGEWLLDLALLDQSFETWSERALAQCTTRPGGDAYLAQLETLDPGARLDEPTAQRLANAWVSYLHGAQGAGFSDCTPGRFLLPGDLAGSPALTFAPLPPSPAPRGSLAREFERRFEAYKAKIIKPFFRQHFARIDRQIVLVDVLSALHAGPEAIADLRQTLTRVLGAFRPGRNSFLSAILGKRVEKILIAATKADHLHHAQHPRLEAMVEALVADATRRAAFSGATTGAMAIAALRSTVEEEHMVDGAPLGLVRGTLLENGRQAALHPGDLPDDPHSLLSIGHGAEGRWLDGEFDVMRFAPPPHSLRRGDGPPHIRLDRAVEFLIGDRL